MDFRNIVKRVKDSFPVCSEHGQVIVEIPVRTINGQIALTISSCHFKKKWHVRTEMKEPSPHEGASIARFTREAWPNLSIYKWTFGSSSQRLRTRSALQKRQVDEDKVTFTCEMC